MICYRCLHVYSIETAKFISVKRLANKQPACPKCKCMVYM